MSTLKTNRIENLTTADGGISINNSGNVGIGTTSPGDYNAQAQNLVVADSGNSGITIAAGSASNSTIWFADGTTGTAPYIGGIRYTHVDNVLQFHANASERMRIDSSGALTFSGNSSSNWTLYAASDTASYSQIDAHFPASNRTLFFNSNTSNNSYAVWNRNSGSSGKGFGLEGQNFKVVQGSSEQLRVDSSGRLLVGTSSAISTGSGHNIQAADSTGAEIVLGRSATSVAADVTLAALHAYSNGGSTYQESATIKIQSDGAHAAGDKPGRITFSTTADGASSPTERMRLDKLGRFMVGTTDHSPAYSDLQGVAIDGPNGYIAASRASQACASFNRRTSDGKIIDLMQAGTVEGTISVSGTTVTLVGGHLSRWSQLPGGAERIEILRGTVLSNLDEMCEWGDEDNEQLNRMQVSDVEGDRNVAGVFQSWDDDDDTYTNDFHCAMTGDFVIRIAQGATVARGDLLISAGDGTAKPQDDDIVRSKTIAKVTSTVVSETYADGSYCVPCVLMAC